MSDEHAIPDHAGAAHQRDRIVGMLRVASRQVTPPPLAYSTDGRRFAFQTRVVDALPIGGFVEMRPESGPVVLGQVTSAAVEVRDGPEVGLAGGAGLGLDPDVAEITHTSIRLRVPVIAGAGTILAVLDEDAVRDPGPADVFDNATIAAADPAIIAAFLDRWSARRLTVDVGRATGVDGERARLAAEGFGRHTFLCGQSGSGKSYALGVILERLLLETSLRVVVLDPNGDFVHLGELRPRDEVRAADGRPLDEDAHAALRVRHAAATERLHVFRAPALAGDEASAIRAHFSEFAPDVQAMVLRLDPIADRDETHALRRVIERFGDGPYTLADVRAAAAADLSNDARQVALRIDNLGVANWSIWADRDQDGLMRRLGDDWRAVVLDTGGFTVPQESNLVALGALNVLWNAREDRDPVLVVIDEAHNVCPADAADLVQGAATQRAIRIAGEGRKFGMFLLFATQRPQKVHPNVLSQADNLVLMRMNSAGDLEHLRETFSFVPPAMLDQAARFGLGESLLAGRIVPAPLFARIEGRFTAEGGGDVPATWAAR